MTDATTAKSPGHTGFGRTVGWILFTWPAVALALMFVDVSRLTGGWRPGADTADFYWFFLSAVCVSVVLLVESARSRSWIRIWVVCIYLFLWITGGWWVLGLHPDKSL